MSVVEQVFSNPDVVAVLVALGGLLAKKIAAKIKLTKKQKENLDMGFRIAYDVVTDEQLTGKVKHLDKAARGVEVLREYLGTLNQEPSEADVARAKLVFSARHAQEKKAAQ